jgi:MFS family permease
VQLRAAEAVAWSGGRRPLVLWTAALHALLWVPVALAWPLFGGWAVVAVIGCYSLGTAASALGGPAWGSMVSEYLPADRRGAFFGVRARIVGLWSTVASLVAGGVLQLSGDRPLVGFALVSAGAGLARVASWMQLRRLHEDPWQEHPHLRFTFWQFLRALPRSNFARFTVCLAAMNFAAHVAAPYFAVFMLEELRFGYATYTAIVVAGSITGFMTSAWWGRLGDRVGNQAVVRWTAAAVAGLPVLWALIPHPLWLGLLNVTGAFAWAGLNLASVNFLYDAVTPPKRHTCLAYFNLLNGVGIALGAACGGFLVEHLPPGGAGTPYVLVFLVSGVLRALAALAFPRFVREVREVHEVGLREVVLDEAGQRLEQVLGFFSVRPERERRRRRSRAADDLP